MTCLTRTWLSTYAFLALAFAAPALAANSWPATINLAAPDDQQSTGAPGDIQTAAGQWDILAGHPTDDVAADLAKFDGWSKAAVPGGFWPAGNPSCCWAMKRFRAPADDKDRDCEILFERVQWSATVWLNGQKLGSWPDGYSPFRLLATRAIKPSEENVLVVRIGGFAEVPKSKGGKPLFPAGFAMAGQGGGGGIMGRVFVRFFNKVRITRLQVLPDIANSTVKVMVRVEGSAPEAEVYLTITEAGIGQEGAGADTKNKLWGAGSAVKLVNGVGEAIIPGNNGPVPAKIKDVKLWEPAKPFLYRLDVRVAASGKEADQTFTRFGMREVALKSDGFYLNGHKVALFGWNGFGDQPLWRGALFSREKFKEGVMAGAKAMNAVCVRSHTGPFPSWFLDMCDEEGLMVLSEFAVTVNCGKIDLDAAEFAAWQADMEMEAGSVVPYLANHPAIVMWVMTNESNNWHEYERGRLYQHFKKLDPSRPTIRAAYDTPEARDIHSYAAMWKGSDGDFAFRCKMEAAKAARDKVPVMCSEYLGGVGGQVTRKWFGPDADNAEPAVRKRLAADVSQFWAFRCMEQTEAVRRMGYSCILPFGYFGGVGPNTPKDPPPAPALYAIPSALAPVGVSVDLDNSHFLAGRDYKTDIWVMNDTGAKVSAKVTVVLTATDPGFDPEAPLAAPKAIWQQTLNLSVAAHSREIKTTQWKAPADEGLYYLLAKLDRDGAKPVTSHRLVYSVKRDPSPGALAGKRVLIIEEPDKNGVKKLTAWVGKLGCKLVDPAELPTGGGPAFTQPDIPLVIVASRLMKVTPDGKAVEPYRNLADRLLSFCNRGGHAIVLEQFAWPTKPRDVCITLERTDYDFNDNNAPADMAGVTTAGTTTRPDDVMADVSESQASGGSSRVFRWEQPERAIWKGIANEFLYNWNGSHGRVARVSMTTYPGRGRILVKYAEAERDDIKFVPVVATPTGLGELLYFMLQVDGRYDPADPDYDPVVERVMVNLLK